MQRNTHWRIPPLAWPPIAAAIVAEATSNGLRAYGLGSHLTAYSIGASGHEVSLAGAVLVLAAIAVSLSQSRAAWLALTPMAPARQRWLAGLAAALLLAVSAAAMASHILEAQRAKTGGEAHERTAWALARDAYDKAKAEADRLGAGRSTDEVRKAMDAVRVPKWAFEESKECTAADVRDAVAKLCRPILDLRKDMAAAISRADARRELAAASAKLAALQPQPEASADETWLSRWWAWLMGAAVVIVATFGPVLFARVEDGPARSDDTAGPSVTGADEHAKAAAPAMGSGPSDCPKRPAPVASALAGTRAPSGNSRADKQQVLEALLTDLALGRGFGSQDELAQRFGRRKSTISDWLRQWEREKLIPVRRPRGRCKALGAA